jgi:hypothetical protein
MNAFATLLALLVGVTYNNDLPPVKYQDNPPPSVVIIVDKTNSEKACGVASEGWTLVACEWKTKEGVPVIMIDNPCKYPEAKDVYTFAHRMCHEFGHANGWNAKHNN